MQVFGEVDGKRILLGTLSVEHRPQLSIDLVFEKEFELLHTSKTYNIFFSGYQAADARRYPFAFIMIFLQINHE